MPDLLLKVALVAVGGALGATGRFVLGELAHRLLDPRLTPLLGGVRFPVGTLFVNIIGCFAIGMIMQLLMVRGMLDDRARLLLVVGVLGSFTTFSAFGYETFELIERGRWSMATMFAAISLAIGIGAVYAGWWAAGGGQFLQNGSAAS